MKFKMNEADSFVLAHLSQISGSLGVRTCELFLCFVPIVRVRAIVLTSLFSLFYVTCEFHRFSVHRGRAQISFSNFSTDV